MNITNTEIYEKTNEEALKSHEETIFEIEAFKRELEEVRQNLESNQKHLFQNVMTPITSKALIKGKLVHTNEVFVYLGDNWFLKTSAAKALEICNRRTQWCNENLAEEENRIKRFCSNIEKAHEFDIFPTDDVTDIMEPYNEETEKLWREKHKEKVKEYKRQQALERDLENTTFEKLNKLEEQENERAELASGTSELMNVSRVLHDHNLTSVCDSCEHKIAKSTFQEKLSKKRVSFSDLDENQDYSEKDFSLNDINVIGFTHSANMPVNLPTKNQLIHSPSDIYRSFFQNYNLKSILKNKVQPIGDIRDDGQHKETQFYVPESLLKNVSAEENQAAISDINEFPEDVFEDITEHISSKLPKMNQATRTMSKFKKSRVGKLSQT